MPENGFKRPVRDRGANPLAESPELFAAALNEFSAKAYDEASQNDIIKASGMSKGSFYYRFADKQDLYLCLIDKIAKDKLYYFSQKHALTDFPEGFFDQLRVLALSGLEYAGKEPRYYAFWRRFLNESGAIRQAVKEAFPDAGRDGLSGLIQAAARQNQFRKEFSLEFIQNIMNLLFNNFDMLLKAGAGEEELMKTLDELIGMLSHGLKADK